MPLVDIDVNDALEEPFGGDVSDVEYLFDNDDDGEKEEDFLEAEQEEASSTEGPQDDGELPLTSDQIFDDETEALTENPEAADLVYGDENDVQAETRSHFSDSSSDEEGWDSADALQKFRAATEAMKSRMSADANPEDASGDASSERVGEGRDDGADEANIDSANQVPVDSTEQVNIESSAEEPVVYEINETRRPWLHNAHLDGALLPIAGYGEDDLYRRDAIFFHTGRGDPTRGGSPVGLSRGKPTSMSIDGVIQRIKSQRDEARGQRNELWHESKELKAELEGSGEEIGMLKHAVDTRDENARQLQKTIDARDEQLSQVKEVVQGWKQRSEQWKNAFEQQQPLANAERERQMMIDADVDFSRSVETQTSPVEVQTADHLGLPNSILSTHAATQADADIADTDDILALTRERDSLLEENMELSDQTRRLRSLLEDWKEWVEEQSWVPKGSVQKENAETFDKSWPTAKMFEPSDDSSSPEGENVFSDALLPLNWTAQHRPERWVEREQAVRKTASWIRARDECAAQLDAWEKQFWASANAEAVACG